MIKKEIKTTSTQLITYSFAFSYRFSRLAVFRAAGYDRSPGGLCGARRQHGASAAGAQFVQGGLFMALCTSVHSTLWDTCTGGFQYTHDTQFSVLAWGWSSLGVAHHRTQTHTVHRHSAQYFQYCPNQPKPRKVMKIR